MNLFNGISISGFFIVNVNSSLNSLAKFIDPFWDIFPLSDRNYESDIEIDSKGQGKKEKSIKKPKQY